MPKNRYMDILPFEHTRVKLKSREACEKKDQDFDQYINANYLDVSKMSFYYC